MLVPRNPIEKRTGFLSIHTKHLNLFTTWCNVVDFMSTQTFLGHFVSILHHTCSGVSATGPHWLDHEPFWRFYSGPEPTQDCWALPWEKFGHWKHFRRVNNITLSNHVWRNTFCYGTTTLSFCQDLCLVYLLMYSHSNDPSMILSTEILDSWMIGCTMLHLYNSGSEMSISCHLVPMITLGGSLSPRLPSGTTKSNRSFFQVRPIT